MNIYTTLLALVLAVGFSSAFSSKLKTDNLSKNDKINDVSALEDAHSKSKRK